MSFSSDAKNEVVKSDLPQDVCCAKAELSALFRTCGGLSLENGKYSIELVTEIADLYSRVLSLTLQLGQLILFTSTRVYTHRGYIVNNKKVGN